MTTRKVLKFEAGKCTGCRLCALACSGSRSGGFSEAMANVGIDSRYVGDELTVSARLCDLCGACVESCPSEALRRGEKVIELDRESCVSCGSCVQACPRRIVYLHESFPVFCNLCEGSPWCGKMCPREAITYEEVRS